MDENYKFCYGKFNGHTVSEEKFKLFANCIKVHTQNNFNQDNFVVKLYPRMLTLSSYSVELLENYKLKLIENLTYFTNIRKYDKVYFLNRNLVDSICSWAYGNYINCFNFYDSQTFISTTQHLPLLNIDLNTDNILKFYILESAILSSWKKFIDSNNISHITLDYDDIPDYIKNNFDNTTSNTIYGNLNYKKLITNYSLLEEQVLNYYNLCLQKVNNLTYI